MDDMYLTYEEVSKSFEEKGYTTVKGSEASEQDYYDTSKVVIKWA